MSVRIISREDVQKHLSMGACIDLLRPAMVSLARGETLQLPRQILKMDAGHMFGVMPGAMGGTAEFGAKIISVYPENFAKGLQSHQGPVVLFDPETGAMVAMLHAGEITGIRTAAASAVATDALARKNASRLAVLGYGEQAEAHVKAMKEVRDITSVTVWGRSAERCRAFADNIQKHTGIECLPHDSVKSAVRDADIICTTTSAYEPVLMGEDVAPGTHLNVVGSSHAGPAEIDNSLVAKAEFFADHTPFVLAQGAEFLRAKEAGLVDDSHILAEIGEVLDGKHPGRTSDTEITIYKSLGHVVQDLASGWYLYTKSKEQGFGTEAAF
ncbi:ornithine cyclodeaminase family protein [Kordiimonas pumila]|uniref:Ornithine cyclodeaminase family protein n=1 Tax=Kordiimonas pumila TaxID=2161677 RepID=A0ABV7D7F3_9PROT|nr:ornithine cyclodeaminase family protein [Kordiimonas pumila]